MLKKKFRISRKDLDAFFKERSRFFSVGRVSLKFSSNNKEYSRWAFVVSARQKRSAVIRNKTRRRMGNIAVILQSKIKKGYDLVFFINYMKRRHRRTIY